MALRTYKYRIYPTPSQQRALVNILNQCRWVYNNTLEFRKQEYEEHQRTHSAFDTIKRLPSLKQERPELKQVHSQVLQDVCRRLDKGFQAFFRRLRTGEKPGYPRFKSYRRYHSFTFPQSGFAVKDDKYLQLSKVGKVRIILHRPLPEDIKTLTIKRTPAGKFYASFAVDVPAERAPCSEKETGIDVGLTHFATFSDGLKINNPRFLRKLQSQLAKEQRKLSALEDRSSKLYKKQRTKVARVHEKIRNQRSDFTHKLSRQIINRYKIIAVEDLNVRSMMESGERWVKSIADAAWSQLLAQLEYKAASAGRILVQVDPRGTSQRCHRCQTYVPKDLSVRVHDCPRCHLSIDRDINSAREILRLGHQSLKEQRSAPLSLSRGPGL